MWIFIAIILMPDGREIVLGEGKTAAECQYIHAVNAEFYRGGEARCLMEVIK